MRSMNGDVGCAEYNRLGRRDFLKAGALSALGLGISDLLRLEAASAAPRREMSCILFWLRGGPSSIDMWDLKPDAPADIRGEFRPIPTCVDGIQISEHLPLTARQADKFVLVRSVTHPRADHEGGSHYMATGWNTFPAQVYPGYGSVVAHELGFRGPLPPYIHLPEGPRAYTGATSYLSAQYGPYILTGNNDPELRVNDIVLPDGVTEARFQRRQSLRKIGSRRLAADGNDTARAIDRFYEKAYDLLSAPHTRQAFDVTREPDRVRDRYGRAMRPLQVTAQGADDVTPNEYNRSIVGQGLLMARRLVEAGVRFVTVVGRGWDTHTDNFNRLKNDLLPYVDRALSALLEDLHQRGMLETTLVMVTGDFNRTPRINKDAGRDHWPHVQTVFLAGGGIQGGQAIGASDANGEQPAERPIAPHEISATLFHKFGINPGAELISPQGRPFRILPDESEPVRELR